MAKKEQTVIFKDVEIMSARELKKKYGLHRKLDARMYDMHEIEQILEEEKNKPKSKRSPRGANVSTDPCANCPLKGGTQVRTFGDFNSAKVIFIGEAPGENEVEQRVPFVGKAGQKLREVLKELHFTSDEVAFANVCRCRPLGTRAPAEKEIACCVRYLRNELLSFKGLRVLLGGVALKALLGRGGVHKNRGYGFFKDGRKFFVTYHPSFILREDKEEYESVFRDDLRKVKVFLEKKFKIRYNTINNMKELAAFMSNLEGRIKEKGKVKLSFDIETTERNPLDEETKILSIAFSTGDDSWFIPLEHPESVFRNKSERVVEYLNPIFNNDAVQLIGQYSKFDIRFLIKKYDVEVTNFWFDTGIAHFLMEGKITPQGLKQLAWKYTEHGGYDVDANKLTDMPLDEVADYNVMDAFVQYKLMGIFWERMSEKQQKLLTEIVCPAVLAVAEMENEGVKVDEKNLERFTKEYSTALQKIEKQMHEYPEIQEMEKKREELVNFNSGDQIREILSTLGLEPKRRTKKRQAVSTDEEALKEVKGKHPIINDILKYRGKDKILGTYLTSYKNKMVDGIVHGDYWFTRTITGRLACHKPNFQNIPYSVRPVFTAKNDFLVEVDFGQLELRVLAMYSEDDALVKAFNEGRDIHEETRQNIFGDATGLSVAKKTKQRVDAKSVNFGIAYGISAHGLAKGINVSKAKAQEMIDTFYARYPKAKKYVEKMHYSAKNNGYVETVFGRRRYFYFKPGLTDAQRARLLREAVNTPIQGTASDLVLKAMAQMWREMRRKNMRSRNIAQVHDLILFDVLDAELEDLIGMIKPAMEHLPFDFINVPLVVDIKAGTHWGELAEV